MPMKTASENVKIDNQPSEISNAKRAIVIFSSRESRETLSLSIESVLTATRDTAAILDIIINGNLALAEEIKNYITSIHFTGEAKKLIRLWFLPVADKARAWNVYLHEICPFTDIVYFIDGYVQVAPNSLNNMAIGLYLSKIALAASGVPTMGAQAKKLRETMLTMGGIHGNLYAVYGKVLKNLHRIGFKLPLGLYRGDALLGAVMCFNLNPAKYTWDHKRILICPDATWISPTLKWWRMRDIQIGFIKLSRQAMGNLEERALKYYLSYKKIPIEELPETVFGLVSSWAKNFPLKASVFFLRYLFCLFEILRLVYHKNWMQLSSEKVALIEEINN